MKPRVTGIAKIMRELKQATETASRSQVLQRMARALESATPVDTGLAASKWEIKGNQVVNDSDYLSTLNSGSSVQAPQHFIELTLLSIPGVHPNGVIVTKKD